MNRIRRVQRQRKRSPQIFVSAKGFLGRKKLQSKEHASAIPACENLLEARNLQACWFDLVPRAGYAEDSSVTAEYGSYS